MCAAVCLSSAFATLQAAPAHHKETAMVWTWHTDHRDCKSKMTEVAAFTCDTADPLLQACLSMICDAPAGFEFWPRARIRETLAST